MHERKTLLGILLEKCHYKVLNFLSNPFVNTIRKVYCMLLLLEDLKKSNLLVNAICETS